MHTCTPTPVENIEGLAAKDLVATALPYVTYYVMPGTEDSVKVVSCSFFISFSFFSTICVASVHHPLQSMQLHRALRMVMCGSFCRLC